MKKEVTESQKSEVPETINAVTFQELLKQFEAQQDEKQASVRRESKAERRKVWAKNLDDIPMETIEKVDNEMKEYVDRFILSRIEFEDGPRELSEEEIDKLAEEYLSYTDINDLIQSRYSQIKHMVFGALDVQFEKAQAKAGMESDTPPEQMPGELVSKNKGIRFKREGGKRKDPSIDWSKLLEAIGEEKFKELVCDRVEVPEQIIPAHVDFVPNGEKLMAALNENKLGLEDVREALIPGTWNSPRFVPRKL